MQTKIVFCAGTDHPNCNCAGENHPNCDCAGENHPNCDCAEKDHSFKTRNKSFLSLSSETFIAGLGLEIDYRLNGQNAVGYSLLSDDFMGYDPSEFSGLHYRRYLGNSVFLKIAVGIGTFQSLEAFKTDHFNIPAGDVIMGNEWIFGNWFTLGLNWFGLLFGYDFNTQIWPSIVHLPGLRLGVNF